MWEEYKQQKIELLRRQQEEEQVEGCSFKPDLSPTRTGNPKADYSLINAKAIENFLKRQFEARAQKEDRETYWQTSVGSGQKWTKKTTHAQSPSFIHRTEVSKFPEDNSSLAMTRNTDNQELTFKQAQNFH